MKTYHGVIHKDLESSYGISFPELPGCTACSDSIIGVLEKGREALELYLEHQDELPQTKGLEYVLEHSDHTNRITVYPFEFSLSTD